MAVYEITNDNFDKEVMQSDKPVLLDFWASWCGPCKMISPVVDEISDEVSEIKVGKVNVDEQPELAQKYGIRSSPTLLLIENGELKDTSVGVVPKQRILDMIK